MELNVNSGEGCLFTGRDVFHHHDGQYHARCWWPRPLPAWKASSGAEIKQQKLSVMNMSK